MLVGPSKRAFSMSVRAQQKLRVGYIPEHFCSPLLQLAAKEPDTIQLVNLPSGTGQHMKALDEGQIDVSIALTESLLAGLANGRTSYKLTGQYVTSPLVWGIFVGAKSRYQKVADLRGGRIGISRVGSGSQVMASVLALREKWFSDPATQTVEALDFVVRDNFKGLRDGVNADDAWFCWETFTTKPFVDAGELREIGQIPTPWQSWAIAATPSTDAAALTSFLEKLSVSVRHFDSVQARAKENVDFIVKEFGYAEADVHAWLKTVKYPENCARMPESVVQETLKTLAIAGVVKTPSSGWQVEHFVRTDVADVQG